jgi:hypothetical protein
MFAIDDVKDSNATNTHGKEDKAPAPNSTPSLADFEKKIKSLTTFAQLQNYWNTLTSDVKENEEYKKIINSRNEEIKNKK